MASNNYSNMTPRQKMINLMYIVLTAMLALNVSTDVLEGFRQVEDSLARSTENASEQNNALYQELTDYNITNPEKSQEWYSKATDVRKRTEELVNYIESLKLQIVQQADGDDGDVNNIKRMDDLEAASHIMLSPAKGQGEKLRTSLTEYADYVTPMVNDSIKRKVISEYLYPIARNKDGIINNKKWEVDYTTSLPNRRLKANKTREKSNRKTNDRHSKNYNSKSGTRNYCIEHIAEPSYRLSEEKPDII